MLVPLNNNLHSWKRNSFLEVKCLRNPIDNYRRVNQWTLTKSASSPQLWSILTFNLRILFSFNMISLKLPSSYCNQRPNRFLLFLGNRNLRDNFKSDLRMGKSLNLIFDHKLRRHLLIGIKPGYCLDTTTPKRLMEYFCYIGINVYRLSLPLSER